MAADKLGRYMTSQGFLARAKAAVAAAVRELEAKGIKPAYGERSSTREMVQAVIAEADTDDRHKPLCNRLGELARTPAGSRLVDDATAAIASVLLLAKTAMPCEETKFLNEIREQLAQVRAQPALIEWAQLLIETERGSSDAIRDRSIIDDALFELRIEAITEALAQ